MAVSLALADELFLMVHDLRTGKPRLSGPALGIGLSAALLAELVFAGALVISEGRLELGEYAPPAERLSEALFEQTGHQLFNGDVSVRDWLAAERRLALDLVADRMMRAGELRREEQQRFGRTVPRWYPQRPTEAFLRTQRLSSYLRNRVDVSAADVVLAGLITVMSPGRDLLEVDADGHAYLGQLLPLLPLPLQELIAITESSIASTARLRRWS